MVENVSHTQLEEDNDGVGSKNMINGDNSFTDVIDVNTPTKPYKNTFFGMRLPMLIGVISIIFLSTLTLPCRFLKMKSSIFKQPISTYKGHRYM